MAIDIFLTIPGISGEGKTSFRIPGSAEIPITLESYSFGLSGQNEIGSTSAGSGAGKAEFSALNITKAFDIASPLLLQALTSGEAIKTMTLSLVKTTLGVNSLAASAAFLTYQFGEVFVTSVQDSGNGGNETVAESVTFAVGRVAVNYLAQSSTGKGGKGSTFNWNVVTASTT